MNAPDKDFEIFASCGSFTSDQLDAIQHNKGYDKARKDTTVPDMLPSCPTLNSML